MQHEQLVVHEKNTSQGKRLRVVGRIMLWSMALALE